MSAAALVVHGTFSAVGCVREGDVARQQTRGCADLTNNCERNERALCGKRRKTPSKTQSHVASMPGPSASRRRIRVKAYRYIVHTPASTLRTELGAADALPKSMLHNVCKI